MSRRRDLYLDDTVEDIGALVRGASVHNWQTGDHRHARLVITYESLTADDYADVWVWRVEMVTPDGVLYLARMTDLAEALDMVACEVRDR